MEPSEVATRFPEGAWSWLFGSFPCRVDYVVQAPRKCSLKINAVSSEILAEGFEGEFSFHSVSGEMTLRELTGPVKVNTVSGEVELAELTGDLRLNTVSGKVSGKRIRGPCTPGYGFREGIAGRIEPDLCRWPPRSAAGWYTRLLLVKAVPLQFGLRRCGTAGAA